MAMGASLITLYLRRKGLARCRRRRLNSLRRVIPGSVEVLPAGSSIINCCPRGCRKLHQNEILEDKTLLLTNLTGIGRKLECQSEASFVKRVLQFQALAKSCCQVHLHREFHEIMQDILEPETGTLKVRMHEKTYRHLKKTRQSIRDDQNDTKNVDDCYYLQPSVFDAAAHEALDAMEIAGMRRGLENMSSQWTNIIDGARLWLSHGNKPERYMIGQKQFPAGKAEAHPYSTGPPMKISPPPAVDDDNAFFTTKQAKADAIEFGWVTFDGASSKIISVNIMQLQLDQQNHNTVT